MPSSPTYHGGGVVRLTLSSNGAQLADTIQVFR